MRVSDTILGFFQFSIIIMILKVKHSHLIGDLASNQSNLRIKHSRFLFDYIAFKSL